LRLGSTTMTARAPSPHGVGFGRWLASCALPGALRCMLASCAGHLAEAKVALRAVRHGATVSDTVITRALGKMEWGIDRRTIGP
jgi:hypothetical protein